MITAHQLKTVAVFVSPFRVRAKMFPDRYVSTKHQWKEADGGPLQVVMVPRAFSQ